MKTEQELFGLAEKYIAKKSERAGIEFIFSRYEMEDFDFGIVFYFTSKLWHETGDFKYAIAGNGPFLIEYKTGDIYQLSSGLDLKDGIIEYKAGILSAVPEEYF